MINIEQVLQHQNWHERGVGLEIVASKCSLRVAIICSRILEKILTSFTKFHSVNCTTYHSKVNGKMEILTPVDLKPLKILKPKLDKMIMSWAPSTLPIFV